MKVVTSDDIEIVQVYFQTLSPYRKATRVVGKPANSANIDEDFGSHVLLPPWQTHLVDIWEFLQMTCIQQHGIKVLQLKQKIAIDMNEALNVIIVIAI